MANKELLEGLPDQTEQPKRQPLTNEELLQGLPNERDDLDLMNSLGLDEEKIGQDALKMFSLNVDPVYSTSNPNAVRSAIQNDPRAERQLKHDMERIDKTYAKAILGAPGNSLKNMPRPELPPNHPANREVFIGMPTREESTWSKMRNWLKEQLHIYEKEELEFYARQVGKTPEQLADEIFESHMLRANRYMRDDIVSSMAQMGAGAAGVAQWALGEKVGANLAANFEAFAESTAPEDPNFIDQLIQGGTSMAMFYIPGVGAGRAAQLFSSMPRLARGMQISAMAATESAIEAGLVYRDVISQGKGREEAEKAANWTFIANLPLNYFTDKLGIFPEDGSMLQRYLKGFLSEGTQEGVQEEISTYMSRNEHVTLGDFVTSFAVGGLVGGPTGLMTALAERSTLAREQGLRAKDFRAQVAESEVVGVKQPVIPTEGATIETEGITPEVAPEAPTISPVRSRIEKGLENLIPSEESTGMPGLKAEIAEQFDSTPEEVEQAAQNILDKGMPSTDMERALLMRVYETEQAAEIPVATEQDIESIAEGRKSTADIFEDIKREGPLSKEVSQKIMEGIEQRKKQRTAAAIEGINSIFEGKKAQISVIPNPKQIAPMMGEQSNISEAIEVKLPNGPSWVFITESNIAPNDEALKLHLEKGTITEQDVKDGNYVILGANTWIGNTAVVMLGKGSNFRQVGAKIKDTVFEEAYEAIEKALLTEEEKTAVIKEHGNNIENRAEAFIKWNGIDKTVSGWQKIKNFFRRITSVFGKPKPLTADEVFRRIKEEDVIMRAPLNPTEGELIIEAQERGESLVKYEATTGRNATVQPSRFTDFPFQSELATESLETVKERIRSGEDVDFTSKEFTDNVLAVVDEDVSGFKEARVGSARYKTLVRLQEHLKTHNDMGYYVELDLRNLGGINGNMGHSEANRVYNMQARVIEKHLNSLMADNHTFRHGGDEMSAITVSKDVTLEELENALANAAAEIAIWSEENSPTPDGPTYSEIPHPKSKPDAPLPPGIGIHYAAVQINTVDAIDNMIKMADTIIENRKKGLDNEYREQIEKARIKQQRGARVREGSSPGIQGQGEVGTVEQGTTSPTEEAEDLKNRRALTDDDVTFALAAYHGTPHRFDKFSTQFIGTGEGAQAFGWGLYFTESKNIAKWYAESLAANKRVNNTVKINGNVIDTDIYTRTSVHDMVFSYKPEQVAESVIARYYDLYARRNPEVQQEKLFKEVQVIAAGKLMLWREDVIEDIAHSTEQIKDQEEFIKEIEIYSIEEYNKTFNKIIPISHSTKFILANKENGFIHRRTNHPKEEMERIAENLETIKEVKKEEEARYQFLINAIASVNNMDASSLEYIKNEPYRAIIEVDLHQGKEPHEFDYVAWETAPNKKQIDKIIAQIDKESSGIDDTRYKFAWRGTQFVPLKEYLQNIKDAVKDESVYAAAKAELDNLFDKYADTKTPTPKDVQKRANELGAKLNEISDKYFGESPSDFLGYTGQDVYQAVNNTMFSPEEASKFLLRAGIDGISYPANYLSGGGLNEKNYVVFDENAVSIKDAITFSIARKRNEQTSTPEFKAWFGNSTVVDETGQPKVLYSGHGNIAIYGDTFDPKKGTAGGFYASDDPDIANSYARGKIGVKEYFEHGAEYVFKHKNGKWGKKIWSIDLDEKQQAKLEELKQAKDEYGEHEHIIAEYDNWRKSNKDYDKDAARAFYRPNNLQNIYKFYEGWGYTIRRSDTEITPETPQDTLIRYTSEFDRLLDALGLEWNSYNIAQPGVMAVYANIQKPLRTSEKFPADLLAALKKKAKGERTKTDRELDDLYWTKDFPLKPWIDQIELNSDNAMPESWSFHVPQKALPIIKSFGYDGIIDDYSAVHTPERRERINYITFDSNQIKSAIGNAGTFSTSDPRITFAVEQNKKTGKPIFDIPKYIDDMISLVQSGEAGFRMFFEPQYGGAPEVVGIASTYPDFMKNQGWSAKEVVSALKKARDGKEITERQREIVESTLAAIEELFIGEVVSTKGDFLDLTEFLDEGELDAIVDKTIGDFTKKIKIKQPDPVKLLKNEISVHEKEISRLRRVLGEKNKTIWDLQNTIEAERTAREANQTELADELKQRIDDLQEMIKALKTQRQINVEYEIQGDSRIKYENEVERLRRSVTATRATRRGIQAQTDEELNEAIRKTERELQRATRAGERAGITKGKQQLRRMLGEKQARLNENADKRKLRAAIKRELQFTQPTRTTGKPVGKFTPEIQRVLDSAREAFRMAVAITPDEARERIQNNLNRYADSLPPQEILIENKVLDIVHRKLVDMDAKQLRELLDEIKAFKEQGRLLNAFKRIQFEGKVEKAKGEALDVITGGQGLPPGATTVGVDAYDPKFKENPMAYIKNLAGKFNRAFIGWKDVLDIASRLDKGSNPYESELNKFGDVLKETNAEKVGIETQSKEIQKLAMSAFDIKTSRDLIKKFNQDNEVIELGTFVDLFGNRVQLKYSRAQARKLMMEFLDPTLERTFREGMGFTDEMLGAVRSLLNEQDFTFIQKQIDYYQEYYNRINDVYSAIYGIDLPHNPFYSPIKRDGVTKAKDEIGFGANVDNLSLRAGVTKGSLKDRNGNIIRLKKQSDINVLQEHILEMEHFVAWAEKIRELKGVLADDEVRTAIAINHGTEINTLIQSFLDDFTRGAIESKDRLNWVNKIRINYTKSVLAIKPAITVKQLTSMFAYADSIPVTDFAIGLADFMVNPIKYTRFLKENSTLLRTRGENMERDVKSAMATREYSAFRDKSSYLNYLLLNVQIGDQGAIALGGWPVYKHHYNAAIKRGLSPKEAQDFAIEKFEQVTQSTQQSSDLAELSYWQRGGDFAKLFTMFMSAPNQYFRKEVGAIRNIVEGRGSRLQHMKTIMIYHAILPMVFQYVASGFDWDEDEQLRAVILGPLNGLFLVGPWINDFIIAALKISGLAQPAQFGAGDVAPGAIIEDAKKALKILGEEDMTPEDGFRAIRGLAGAVGGVTGVPLKQVVDYSKATGDALMGNYERSFMEFIGYSPLALEQQEKKERARR